MTTPPAGRTHGAPDLTPEVTELDDATVEVALPAETGSVRVARRFVKERWQGMADEVLGDVELIVSELVANAVRHGRPDIVFRLRAEPFAIDIAVLDHGPGIPSLAASPPDLTATSGRGLTLVDRLASSWGVEPLGEDEVGKTVWASVRCD
ncbi:Anti-sigma regulatory factor (Ser/Thr protein kinase) [Jatrophihabitans endophyticus]|uniref:Anti-sigma regulatory factor (Ser/Thr protein kinase) n=1 Tax=Jatrophihabitans endophyticus TaxID=1206085 RepID=A0A1M5CIB0_9ACTN|nr:ATP-binding protein [Jatrophihabitans endophyticus]SHF54152.1 Anti-sigma regulatory factor (Ser/Thr protein kinase) [Jatrophihabitans endophyticus]